MRKSIGIALFLATVLCMLACSEKGTEETIIELEEGTAGQPQMTEVIRGDMQITMVMDAYAGPKVEQLSFKEGGFFGDYMVQLGDEVKAGDVLAISDVQAAEEEIEQKRLELEDLTANFEYQRATLNNQIEILKLRMDDVYGQIEKEEYMSPEFTALCIKVGNYDEEKKRIELQQKQLQEMYDLELPHYQKQLQDLIDKSTGNVIKAPFDGVIVALREESANEDQDLVYRGRAGWAPIPEADKVINTNQYYVAVADPTVLYVRCDYVSQPVMDVVDSAFFWKDGTEYPVSYIPMTDRMYRDMKNSGEALYSEFAIEGAEGTVLSGDYGKVKLVVAEKKDILLVPQLAVVSDKSGIFVYRDKDGQKEKVRVKIGSRDGISVEILEGLQEGDRVYVQK